MKIISIGISLAFFTTNLIFNSPVKAGIFDDVFGRCGSGGEGKVTVTNNLQATVYVLTDKDDKSGGPDGKELAPGDSNETPICNRNGFRVKVYTAENCGKTFLSESRFDRVYNEEHVTLKPDGFGFSVGNPLDVGSRIAGVGLTYLAAGYGIPPQALAAMGVNEAEAVGACTTGPSECAQALYKYREKLPSDLLTTINADKCLSKAFSSASKPQEQPNSKSGGTYYDFQISNSTNTTISFSIDSEKYTLEPNETRSVHYSVGQNIIRWAGSDSKTQIDVVGYKQNYTFKLNGIGETVFRSNSE
jgi:hypothetical protein